MARRQRLPVRWPAWRYNIDGQGAVFNSEAEVPPGWTIRPDEKYCAPSQVSLERSTLISELESKDIKPHPTWGKAHMKKVLDDISSTR